MYNLWVYVITVSSWLVPLLKKDHIEKFSTQRKLVAEDSQASLSVWEQMLERLAQCAHDACHSITCAKASGTCSSGFFTFSKMAKILISYWRWVKCLKLLTPVLSFWEFQKAHWSEHQLNLAFNCEMILISDTLAVVHSSNPPTCLTICGLAAAGRKRLRKQLRGCSANPAAQLC